MFDNLIDDFNSFCGIAICPENEEIIRSYAHELMLKISSFDKKTLSIEEICLLSCVSHSCRKKMRRLNNMLLCEKEDCVFYRGNINRLMDALVSACQTVINTNDKSFSLYMPGEEISLSFSPKIIIDSVLNIISNSIIYSQEKNITIRLTPLKHGAVISIENKSPVSLEDINAFLDIKFSGLYTARQAARLHKGSLMFSKSGDYLAANIFIPYALPFEKEYVPPSCIDFICDKFSPVYVSLYDYCFECI